MAATRGLSSIVQADLTTVVRSPVGNPTSVSFPGTAVTMSIDLRDVPLTQVPACLGPVGGPGIGTSATPNANGPTIGVSSTRTLQDCAPYPASLYGTAAETQTPFWNEIAGTGSAFNGALLTFSQPVQAFGAWFGDLETRPGTGGPVPGQPSGAGTPAWIKLFARRLADRRGPDPAW